MDDDKKIRLDKYLWAIRLYKTRTQASTAIEAGKVKYKGDHTKASRIAGIGDEYEVRTEARKWIIEVSGIPDTRVQYSEAVKYYIDKTPPVTIEAQKSSFSFNTGKRMNKSGRPTKKYRRDMEDFL